MPYLQHRGYQLAYEVRGEGPPVLLIQEVGVHGGGWQPQVHSLAAIERGRGAARDQWRGCLSRTYLWLRPQ